VAKPKRRQTDPLAEATELRIVGGTFRGRKLRYDPLREGDEPVTRPMKHRVREAIFNLVGMEVKGLHAIDLFAGTGALGLEALSRGAVHATFIERHVPTARIVEANIKSLAVEDRTTLLVTSAFLWGKRDLANGEWGMRNGGEKAQSDSTSPSSPFPIQHSPLPWLVFCSPPFSFFVDRCDDMLELLSAIMKSAPADSIVVVESDERFDFQLLPTSEQWDVRTYSPAVVGVWRNDDRNE
jgi:16S rRNA (guanine966-N2)-methyltransferase